MTFLQTEQPLRLKVDGHRKPLHLRPLRRDGVLEMFAVQGETLEAVRLAPAGVVREAGGRLLAIPEAAAPYAAALDAFEDLGQRLCAVAPRAAVRVEAVVRAASGCFWLQAPSGTTLEDWLARHPGPTPTVVVIAFARRLAAALEELHGAGIVHGDLSPRAVLIDDGQVRLTGFVVDRRPFFRPLRSQQGLVQPGYAPPEAHDGALRHPIGPAADLYAASAILQRLLTGRTPPPANLATRKDGETAWPPGILVPAGLRAGIDAGLSPVMSARPASASAWLAALDPDCEPERDDWFDGLAKTPLAPSPPPPEAEPEPLSGVDPLHVPALPLGQPDLFAAPSDAADAPLTLARAPPKRRQLGWWAAGVGLATLAVAAVTLLAPRITSRPKQPPRLETSPAVTPMAPAGCQWLSAASGWRLRCADAPTAGLRLPERFDVQTTARAAAGEPAAIERLGAFYRLRASETANRDRGAYAYQALGWLQRAAETADDGRPDTARARDDAALALGQMLAHGEGGRAPDPAAAEARLRQAAAGSRADAVLALAQLLETQAGGDAGRMAEARGLYARVAQLGDGSVLQREAEHGLARIDAPSTPPPKQLGRPAEERAENPNREEPARPSVSVPKAQPQARPSSKKPIPKVAAKPKDAKIEAPRRVAPVTRPSTPKVTPPSRPSTPARTATAKPPLRTWTASTFVKVDPTANFGPAVELAGRAACDGEGGETLSVRAGDTLCPNGVNYCQVRAVATCQGARP